MHPLRHITALLLAACGATAAAQQPLSSEAKTAAQTQQRVEARQQSATAAHAQELTEAEARAEAHGDPWSLDSCITYAIAHNLDVRSSILDLAGGGLDLTEARDRFLPTVQAAATQSWSFGRGLTAQNTYAQRNTSATAANLGLQLPLFQGLSALRQLRQAQSRLHTLDLQFEHAKDQVTLQIMGLYLQTLYNREMVNVRAEELRLSETQLRLQQGLLDAGKVPEVDVLQARSQVASGQVSLINAQNDHRLALVDLTRALELRDTEGFDIQAVDFGDSWPVIPKARAVYEGALLNNNGLQAARSAVTDADRAIDVARTGYLPRLSLNGSISTNFYTVAGQPDIPFRQQVRENFAQSIGLSLNIPVFDAFNTRNQVRRARLQRVSAQLEVDRRESELIKTIRQAHSQAEGAEAQYRAGQWAVEAAKAALEAMTDKYTCGRATATEWQQAQTTYITTKAQLLQAKYELILRSRILLFYMDGTRPSGPRR